MKKVLLFSNFLIIFVFVLRFSSLPPQLPLFYSRPWGEDQLADNWMIFLLPLTMNALVALNLYVYKKLFSENLFVKKIVDCLNLFVIASLTLIFIKIVLTVT